MRSIQGSIPSSSSTPSSCDSFVLVSAPESLLELLVAVVSSSELLLVLEWLLVLEPVSLLWLLFWLVWSTRLRGTPTTSRIICAVLVEAW